MRFASLLTGVAMSLGALPHSTSAASTPPPGPASLRSEKVLLRSHFIGATNLKDHPDAARWSQMATTNKGFSDLREQTLQKLASVPFRSLQGGAPAGTADQAALLKPLLADLLEAESFIEWRGTATTTEQLAVALRLPAARNLAWSNSLAAVAKAWLGHDVTPFQQAGTSGWQVRKPHAPNLLGYARVGDWVVVGLGQDQLKLWSDFQAKLAARTTPFPAGTNWLDAQVDWPLVQARIGLPLPFNAPEARLSLNGGKDGNLRIRGTLFPEKAIAWQPERWQVPTNFIHEPLISFTAMRGIGTVFNDNAVLRSLGLNPPPSQLFLWAVDGAPFRLYAAAPYRDASNVVRRISPGILKKYQPDVDRLHLGALEQGTTNPVIIWRGLPLIMPYLASGRSPAGEMLIAGLFPNPPKGNPPPPELLSQFEHRNDMAYYDWEVTEPRLAHWRSLGQLLQIIGYQNQFDPKHPALVWLDSIQKGLGNTATEITVASPRELRLSRTGPMGLTAPELVYLAFWLKSTNFPSSPFIRPELPKPGKRPPAK